MKKMLASTLFLVVAMSTIGLADAAAPNWDISGTWTLNFDFGSPYVHQMTITNFDRTTGEFSGTGYYVADTSYTWDVNGVVSGNDLSFHMIYTGTGAGYKVFVDGTISTDGHQIIGSGSTSAGQTFTLVGDGTAHPILGFDQGYNLKARIFVGTGWTWCMAKVGNPVWCQDYLGAYANDKIVMKWNAAWDACNDQGGTEPDVCLGAWTNNEWNGNVLYGTGAVWHYKIIWVGPGGATSPYWKAGGDGYSIWGNYEVIMDQGIDPSYGPGHLWFAHATPTGYGA